MRWEYKSTRLDFAGFLGSEVHTSTLDQELNRWGAEGWELVNTNPLTGTRSRMSMLCVFKRPIAAPAIPAAS